MPLINKPAFNTVWAATGTKSEPIPAKISQGWVVEIPPFEYQNWAMNRQDQMLAHINQLGIVVWDITVEYQAGKSYVQGSDGVVYRCTRTNTGVNPATDLQGIWVVAFETAGSALLRAENLADIPDKALARANLGITTTNEYDTRYLAKAQNLADVPNKPSARANLDIYSKQEVIDLINALQPAGEVAAFATADAPSGWLVCNGATVSRATYARLFAAIGTRYGAGNGSTTFQLPDLRGEFIRGFDAGRGVDAGRALGTVQGSQNLSHTHGADVSDASWANIGEYYVLGPGTWHGGGVDNGVHAPDYPLWQARHQMSHRHSVTVAANGGNESRPRNLSMIYCIRT